MFSLNFLVTAVKYTGNLNTTNSFDQTYLISQSVVWYGSLHVFGWKKSLLVDVSSDKKIPA